MRENFYERIIDKSTSDGGINGYFFATDYYDSKLRFRINGGTSTYSINNSIIINQWNFVVVTFNSSGRKIYANGVDVTATGGSETGLPPNIASAARIGNRAGATDRTFDGFIDDVRIYDAALSSSQIRQNYIAGLNSMLANGNISKEEYNQRIESLASNTK